MIEVNIFHKCASFIINKFLGNPYAWSGLVIVLIFDARQLARYIFIRDRRDLLKFFVGFVVFFIILISIAVVDNLGDVNVVHWLSRK